MEVKRRHDDRFCLSERSESDEDENETKKMFKPIHCHHLG